VGNFFEDFLFGAPDPQTGQTSGGVFDTLWPFEGTPVSTALDSTAGQVATLPVRLPMMIGAGALYGIGTALDYGIFRPASTALQAGATPYGSMQRQGAPVNPLYRDGIQFQDFVDMWNASEYISPARALSQWSYYQGGYGATPLTNVKADPDAVALKRVLDNPYPSVGGASREEYEEAWDRSVLGTVVTGTLDAGSGLIGIPGAAGLLNKAKTAVGLQSTIRNARDLTKLRTTMEGHEVWRTTGGAQGKWNVMGQYVEDLANETSIDKILNNPAMDRWTRSGSFNRDTLAARIAETDDVATIRELLLADRGDTLALGRLFYAAPDHVWSLTDMNEKLAMQFARGGQYFPTQDTARVIGATFDTAVKRDEWWSSVRDMFMSGRMDGDDLVSVADDAAGLIDGIPLKSARGQRLAALNDELEAARNKMAEADNPLNPKMGSQQRGEAIADIRRIESEIEKVKSQAPNRDEFVDAPSAPEEPGLLNAVRGEGSDFVPLGTFGSTPVANAVGAAERWFKSFVADARINRPNQWVEVALGPSGSRPLTTLLFWSGSRQPLNIVNYSRMRPTEVVDEMVAYSRSSRALRNRNWTVSRIDERTGEPIQVPMLDFQWREQAVARLVQARAQGDVALDETVDALQAELISVVVNKYGLTAADAREVVDGMSDWLGQAQQQVARDGFFWDDLNGVTTPEPGFVRQLPSSRILMPLDDLDWNLRQISSSPYARRGRRTRMIMRSGADVLDALFKVFRTNVLFKPGYTPKNSFAEPGVSAILADGSLLATDGLSSSLKRFAINNDRRLMSARYGVIDFLPGSGARKDRVQAQRLADEYATTAARLDELDQHIADLADASPVTQSKYLEAAYVERRILNRQMTAIERELNLTDPTWTDVVEVPTYSALSDRAVSLRSALLDEDFPTVAAARIDELNATAAQRLSGVAEEGSLAERLGELQRNRERLIALRDSLYQREGRRAAERDLKNPAKNKRRDLMDPESPDARRAPDWIEQLARVNDPRDMTSLSRVPGRNDATRRVEAVIRSINYLDEQIAATHAAIRGSRRATKKTSTLTGLTAVEAEELRQIEALLAARGKMSPEEAVKVLDAIDAQLDDIRKTTFVVSPDAKSKAEALRQRLEELDAQGATVAARIAKRELVRDALRRRELSGETDQVVRVGGVDYEIPAPFAPNASFGTAMRAEASADLSQAQNLSGGVDPLGISRTRGLGARWQRIGEGVTIQPIDPRYWDELAYVYDRHVLGDEFANLILSGKTDAEILRWFDRTPEGKAYAASMGWSREALTGGPSGSIKARPLGLEKSTKARITVFDTGVIADTRRLLMQYFPDEAVRAKLLRGEEATANDLRLAMAGREDLSPIYGPGLQLTGNMLAKANVAVNNALDLVWRNLASKPESRFGRWPFFTREYQRQMERSIRLRQDQGLPITGTELQAMRNQARARALKETENSFYNVRRMTNPVFAQRYLASFASAAWNTVYRYGRLAYRRPGTAMVLAWGWESIISEVGVDQDGNRVEDWRDARKILVSLPDEWDIPIDPNLYVSVDTFNFATQDGGYNPVISISTSSILRLKPELEPWLKKNHPFIHEELFGFGTGTDPTFSIGPINLDPATAGYQRRLMDSGLLPFVGGMSDDDFVQSAVLDWKYQLFEWSRKGQQGPMPTLEESAQNAREFYLWNISISALGSGVTGISPEGQFYREEWYRLREKYPDNYSRAQAEMYSLYGPSAYFIIGSTSASRSNMPATESALNLLRGNETLAKDLLNMSTKDPKLTVDLMFLDEMTYSEEEFSQAIYDSLFTTPLPGDDEPIKQRESAVEIEREYKRALSWAKWNASVAARDAALLQLGEKTISQTKTPELYAQWKQFEADFAGDPENALMLEEKGIINTGKTEIAIRAIQSMLTNSKWMTNVKESPTWNAIGSYMRELEQARADFALMGTSADKKAFAAQWDSYVRDKYLPGAGNFSGYYERYLAGRDLSGRQLLERELNIPGFPLKGDVQ